MATISAATNEKVYSIPKWLGVNESPDGSTRLKIGEASQMVNWKITRDGNLKRRPGTKFIAGLRFAGYTTDIAEETVLIGKYNPTDEIVLYGFVDNLTSPGKLTPDNPSTDTAEGWYEAAQGASPDLPEFISFDELLYAVYPADITFDGSKVTIVGHRARAVPVSGNTRPIAGMWSGIVSGKHVLLVACDGHLYSLYDENSNAFRRDLVGAINTTKSVSFIPFDNKVYILNGVEYYVYNGTTLSTVVGYVPLVAITIGPLDTDTNEDSVADSASNPGELTSEYVNRLSSQRRVWISPDGTNGTFQLPEKNLSSIDYVKDLSTGQTVSTWTGSASNGQVAFSPIPPKAVNSYEIGYTAQSNNRSQVTGNLYAELFSGTTDTRIFLYGDGTNRTIYSGMDYDGMPRADYFPDQYETRIGDSNTPITSMIRHYSSLICYKPNECWAIQHGVVELATNELTPAIYSQPVNRDIGNVAIGQVRLVNNNPVSLFGHDAYQWSNSSYYTSNLSRDERQAKRISDRIQKSLASINTEKAMMWDDNDAQEFYISQNGIALVWNYARDVWYRYDNFNATCMCNLFGDLYIGTTDGKVFRLTYDEKGDDGEPINAIWTSGAMDYGANNMRKFVSMLWVGLKPEDGTSVDVTIATDRKDSFKIKAVPSTKARVPGMPFMSRIKLKAKKFVYYYLSLSVTNKQPAVTVTDISVRVRTTGYAR